MTSGTAISDAATTLAFLLVFVGLVSAIVFIMTTASKFMKVIKAFYIERREPGGARLAQFLLRFPSAMALGGMVIGAVWIMPIISDPDISLLDRYLPVLSYCGFVALVCYLYRGLLKILWPPAFGKPAGKS